MRKLNTAGDRLDSDGIGPVADDMDLNFSRVERKAMSSIDWVAQQVVACIKCLKYDCSGRFLLEMSTLRKT